MRRHPHLGTIQKLSTLVTDLRFCRQIVTPRCGSYCAHPPGSMFVSLPGCFRGERGQNWVLHGTPTELFRNAAAHYLVGNGLTSIEIIPWPHTGEALVIGRDGAHIGTAWVAFIPMSEVPTRTQLDAMPLEEIRHAQHQ